MLGQQSMDSNQDHFISLYEIIDQVQQLKNGQLKNSLLQSVSKDAENLISKTSHPMLILSLTETAYCQSWVHSMLLQHMGNPKYSESHPQSDSNSLRDASILLYNRPQFGSAQPEPYYWIFCENGHNCTAQCLQIVGSLSPVIIIQQKYLQENGEQLLHKIIDNQRQLFSGKVPQIYLIRVSHEPQKLQINQLKCRQIVIESDKEVYEADYQLLQRVIQHGREITSNIDPQLHRVCLKDHKTRINQEIAISAQMYIKIFNQFMHKLSQNKQMEYQFVKEICKTIHEQSYCQTLQHCLKIYRQRLQHLSDPPISHKSLQSVHQQASKSVIEDQLYQHTQRVLSKQQRQCLQQRLFEEYQLVAEDIQRKNYQWFKEIIRVQFQSLEKRLLIKHIDLSTPKLVQQLLSWRNSVIQSKNIQSFASKEIEALFLSQFIAKVIELSRAGNFDNSQQLSSLQKQLYEQRQSNKQLRNSHRKKTTQLSVELRSLQQKIAHYTSHEQLLQQTISNLKKSITEQQMDYDRKIAQARKEFLAELTATQSMNHKMKEELLAKKHELLFQSSEIDKEKLLHAQTKKHYEELLGQCRLKESQLNEKLDTAAYEYSENIEEMRISICSGSMKSINDQSANSSQPSIHSQQAKKKIIPISSFLELSQKYEALQTSHQNLVYNFQLLQQENSLQIQQLSLSLKLSQQKVYEYESQMVKHLHLQAKVSDLQQNNASLAMLCKEKEKQLALLKQEKQFDEENKQILMHKLTKAASENQSIHEEMEECKLIIEEKRSKVLVEEWVQTDDDVMQQQQLRSALQIVAVLEEEYNKLKVKIKARAVK